MPPTTPPMPPGSTAPAPRRTAQSPDARVSWAHHAPVLSPAHTHRELQPLALVVLIVAATSNGHNAAACISVGRRDLLASRPSLLGLVITPYPSATFSRCPTNVRAAMSSSSTSFCRLRNAVLSQPVQRHRNRVNEVIVLAFGDPRLVNHHLDHFVSGAYTRRQRTTTLQNATGPPCRAQHQSRKPTTHILS